jgi:hypothetical protein
MLDYHEKHAEFSKGLLLEGRSYRAAELYPAPKEPSLSSIEHSAPEAGARIVGLDP